MFHTWSIWVVPWTSLHHEHATSHTFSRVTQSCPDCAPFQALGEEAGWIIPEFDGIVTIVMHSWTNQHGHGPWGYIVILRYIKNQLGTTELVEISGCL